MYCTFWLHEKAQNLYLLLTHEYDFKYIIFAYLILNQFGYIQSKY